MSDPHPAVSPDGEPKVTADEVAPAIDDPSASTAAGAAPPSPPTEPSAKDPSRTPPYTHTRASGFWAAVVVGLLVLLVLIVFIIENGQSARISFFGQHGHLPQGVALLLAAVIGGLFVVLAGAARILQLRTRARGDKKRARGPSPRRARRQR